MRERNRWSVSVWQFAIGNHTTCDISFRCFFSKKRSSRYPDPPTYLYFVKILAQQCSSDALLTSPKFVSDRMMQVAVSNREPNKSVNRRVSANDKRNDTKDAEKHHTANIGRYARLIEPSTVRSQLEQIGHNSQVGAYRFGCLLVWIAVSGEFEAPNLGDVR